MALAEARARTGDLAGSAAAARALALEPDSLAAVLLRVVALRCLQRVGGPAYLAHWEQFAGRWDDFDANVERFVAALHAAADATDMPREFSAPFALLGLPHHPRDMLQAARLSAAFLAEGVQPLPPRRAHRGGPLRVGYLRRPRAGRSSRCAR